MPRLSGSRLTTLELESISLSLQYAKEKLKAIRRQDVADKCRNDMSDHNLPSPTRICFDTCGSRMETREYESISHSLEYAMRKMEAIRGNVVTEQNGSGTSVQIRSSHSEICQEEVRKLKGYVNGEGGGEKSVHNHPLSPGICSEKLQKLREYSRGKNLNSNMGVGPMFLAPKMVNDVGQVAEISKNESKAELGVQENGIRDCVCVGVAELEQIVTDQDSIDARFQISTLSSELIMLKEVAQPNPTRESRGELATKDYSRRTGLNSDMGLCTVSLDSKLLNVAAQIEEATKDESKSVLGEHGRQAFSSVLLNNEAGLKVAYNSSEKNVVVAIIASLPNTNNIPVEFSTPRMLNTPLMPMRGQLLAEF